MEDSPPSPIGSSSLPSSGSEGEEHLGHASPPPSMENPLSPVLSSDSSDEGERRLSSLAQVKRYVERHPFVCVDEVVIIAAVRIRDAREVCTLIQRKFGNGDKVVENIDRASKLSGVDLLIQSSDLIIRDLIHELENTTITESNMNVVALKRNGEFLADTPEGDPLLSFLVDLGNRMVDAADSVVHPTSRTIRRMMLQQLLQSVTSAWDSTIQFVNDPAPPSDDPALELAGDGEPAAPPQIAGDAVLQLSDAELSGEESPTSEEKTTAMSRIRVEPDHTSDEKEISKVRIAAEDRSDLHLSDNRSTEDSATTENPCPQVKPDGSDENHTASSSILLINHRRNKSSTPTMTRAPYLLTRLSTIKTKIPRW